MMEFSAPLSHVVLVITAAVLFYVALTDFKQFKIRNELILVLAGLFVVHALLSGRWVSAHWNLAFAVLMFCVMLYFYAQNWMGGGDVKILCVGFLWIGVDCALVFAVLLMIFSMVYVLAAKFDWVKVQQVGAHKRIPFAPSVAAALIVSFMLGCLRPVCDRSPNSAICTSSKAFNVSSTPAMVGRTAIPKRRKLVARK
jgi:prepilin peptidase CpaA